MNNKGFVYIMTNESMPGLVKVGMTKRVPDERAKELEDTGVPTPYTVQYYSFFGDMILAEKKAHNALSKYHYNKEFFKTDVGTAIYHIENIGIPFKKLYSKQDDDRKTNEPEQQIQREGKGKQQKQWELLRRRRRIRGYRVGAERVYSDGSKYVGEFKNCKRHGQGIMTFPDGGMYDGEWIYNREAGGWLYDSDGNKLWIDKVKNNWCQSLNCELNL